MEKRIFLWHIAGMIFIFLLGGGWHFVYNLSGHNSFIALIAPVNESVWEHLKLAPIPLVLFSVMEFFYMGKFNKNFIPARTTALYLVPLLIIFFHYSYRIPLGHPILWADILIFGLSVVIGELTSYHIMTMEPLSAIWRLICILAIIVLFIIFAYFTYNPPHWPIFLERGTGTFGPPTL